MPRRVVHSIPHNHFWDFHTEGGTCLASHSRMKGTQRQKNVQLTIPHHVQETGGLASPCLVNQAGSPDHWLGTSDQQS